MTLIKFFSRFVLLSVMCSIFIVGSLIGLASVVQAATNVFSMVATIDQIEKMPVNITFSGSQLQEEIFPFESPQDIYALSITADVELFNDAFSMARVVLIDETQQEYLVYEAYSALAGEGFFSLEAICEETCFLPLIHSFSLRIEVEEASITLREISFVQTPSILGTNDRNALKEKQDKAKIEKINERTLGWVAGETSVSKLFFNEKSKLFMGNKVPNLQGFEYYRGGVFEIKRGFPSDESSVDSTAVKKGAVVDKFDWRNRHGENWLTSVKNQLSCGSCWAFAATGATEAVTNIYFNQHLNLDLAEQDALSCSRGGNCNKGYPGKTLDYFTETGVVDEGCFPYSATTNESCKKNKCRDPQELIRISGKITFDSPKTEEKLKRLIIENGPISGGIRSWNHIMTLVGFKKDFIDGRTFWIFKNSWGLLWGDKGYINVKLAMSDVKWTHAVKNPIIDSLNSYEIKCVDKDNDGFCNWGISDTRPDTCPTSCRPERDCNDSDPELGPFNSDYSCRQEKLCLFSDVRVCSDKKIGGHRGKYRATHFIHGECYTQTKQIIIPEVP